MFMDHVYGLCLWIMFIDHVYGLCLWIMFMDYVYWLCLWIMFMDYVYGSCLWIMFIDYVYGSWSWTMIMGYDYKSLMMILYYLRSKGKWTVKVQQMDLTSELAGSGQIFVPCLVLLGTGRWSGTIEERHWSNEPCPSVRAPGGDPGSADPLREGIGRVPGDEETRLPTVLLRVIRWPSRHSLQRKQPDRGWSLLSHFLQQLLNLLIYLSVMYVSPWPFYM